MSSFFSFGMFVEELGGGGGRKDSHHFVIQYTFSLDQSLFSACMLDSKCNCGSQANLDYPKSDISDFSCSDIQQCIHWQSPLPFSLLSPNLLSLLWRVLDLFCNSSTEGKIMLWSFSVYCCGQWVFSQKAHVYGQWQLSHIKYYKWPIEISSHGATGSLFQHFPRLLTQVQGSLVLFACMWTYCWAMNNVSESLTCAM